MADGSSLKVDTATLAYAGSALVEKAGNLDTSLDSLSGKMSQLTSSWKDSNGTAFVGKFSKFITDSKEINADLKKLGTYMQTMADKYDAAVAEALAGMKG